MHTLQNQESIEVDGGGFCKGIHPPQIFRFGYMDVEPKIGVFTPKMDGENHGKAYEQMDDLGVPLFLDTPI